MEENSTSYIKWLPFLLGLCSAIGMYAGYGMKLGKSDPIQHTEKVPSNYASQQKLLDVLSYLQSKYVDSLNQEENTDFLIQQLVLALDPYSEYLSKKELKNLQEDLDGIYQGAGLSFKIINDQVYVSQVIADGPAQQAGVQIGDIVTEINNKVFLSNTLNVDSIVSIAQSDHDKMELTISQKNNSSERKITLIKTDLPNSSIGTVTEINEQTFYIRINRFAENTYKEFMQVMENFIYKRNFKNLIIDLRSNNGGLLNSAADILNQLVLERNTELFKTRDRFNQERVYKSTGKPFFQIDKIIILINHQTASASEVLAGVLQDLNRAELVGTNSFGKATVLELFPLADGSSLELANARIFLPSGRCIQKPYNTRADSNLNWLSPYKSDTSILHLGTRNFPNGAGLKPDVEINEEESENSIQITLKEMLDKFIIVNYQEIKELKSNKNSANLISSFVLKNLINSSTDKEVIKNKDFILNELKSRLIYFYDGEEAEAIYQLQSDPYIIKAKEMLNFNSKK